MFRTLIERFRPGPEVDLAGAPSYAIEAPPSASPLVVVDVDATFWETLFGGGHGFVGLGNGGGGDIDLAAAPPPKPSTGEPCSGSRFELFTLPGPDPRDAKERRFCARQSLRARLRQRSGGARHLRHVRS